MCMKFGCNCQINFCHFFSQLELLNSHFLAQLLPKHTQLLQFYLDLFEILQMFLSRSEGGHEVWL